MTSLEVKGIIVAMVTPLTQGQKINKKSTNILLDYIMNAGVHGVFVISGAGEFSSLSFEEKKELLEIVVNEVNGRIPVYAGTGAVTTSEAVHLTQTAEKIGANGVSVIAPYSISLTQNELYDYYTEIARHTHLPVILYNHPKRTGLNLSVDLVKKLSHAENIVGIKDSSGDLSLTIEYIRCVDDGFSVLMGIDTLIYASLACGAQGAISSTANVTPKLAVKIYESVIKGDYQTGLKAQYDLIPLRRAFALGTFPAVLKESLNLIGIPVGSTRRPVESLNEENKENLRQLLVDIGILKSCKHFQSI